MQILWKYLSFQAVAIRRMLEPVEKLAAKERMIAAHASPGKLPELNNGRSRDKVAAFTGVAARTLDKADADESTWWQVATPMLLSGNLPECDAGRTGQRQKSVYIFAYMRNDGS